MVLFQSRIRRHVDMFGGAWCTLLLVLCLYAGDTNGQTGRYNIGVFQEQYKVAMAALQTVAPPSGGTLNMTIIPEPSGGTLYDRTVEIHAAFISNNYRAIVGPFDPSVAMVTDKLAIPYVVTDYGRSRHNNVFYMGPYPAHVVSCILSMVEAYRWRKVAILVEERTDPMLVNDLLRDPDIDLRVFQLDENSSDVSIGTQLRKLRHLGIKEILVIARPATTKAILRQGHRLSIIAQPYSWIMINLGAENIDDNIIEDLQVNVTSVELVQSHPSYSATNMSAMNVAIVSDAVHVLHHVSMTTLAEWSWLPLLHDVSVEGHTGIIEFDQEGLRDNYQLKIFAFNVTENTYDQVGHWDKAPEPAKSHLKFYHSGVTTDIARIDFPLLQKLVKVVTIFEKPWVMLKPDHESREGNDRFEGFVVDFMVHVAEELDFTYELYIVGDGNFGAMQPNGEWNGIVGEILAGNASMSVAPLSINAERERAIDFTKPFKTRGITVLIKTPESESSYFQFLSPLSIQVWVGVVMAMAVLSVLLYAFEKYSKSQRRDMPKLNAMESCWFIFGSIVSGSTESSPVTVSGRILTSAWWFFSLILISTYTANLAAFLTVKKMIPPIKDVADLASQSKIQYGTVRDSGVMAFFRTTRVQPFQKMWEHMELLPDSLVNSTEEGMGRVREGDYAFLWDNSVNGYHAATDCDFTEIGPSFDPKGFGIGMPPGASYRDKLSLAILGLADKGVISELEHRWWLSSSCPDYRKPSIAADETAELQLENVAGIFFVLAFGVAIGLLACIVDRLLQRKWKQMKEKKKRKANESTVGGVRPATDNANSAPYRFSYDRPLADTNL